MHSESEEPEVFEFVDLYLDDLELGTPRPLTEYLSRFPGHEEAVAREFLSLKSDQSKAPKEDDQEERRLGPYRLLGPLGRGGQGEVFLAEDTRFARRVALKVLVQGSLLLDEERLQRFRREAEVVGRLQHPGICPVLDADLEARPPWIAMQLLEGESLASALAQAQSAGGDKSQLWFPKRAVSLHSVLRFFESAARALHVAHEAGVVHRDVKPGNIMIGESHEPVLLDFGLARDEEAEEEHLTQEGEVFGTLAYMSPEQLRGQALDRRADVYSLGVTLFEALTLERPFRKDSRAELMLSIDRDTAPDPRRTNPALPPELTVVLATALEKDLDRRYPTALALAEDLRRIRHYEPIQARPAGLFLRSWRWVQRHPAVTSSLLLLSLGLAASVLLLLREQRALRYARGRHLAARAESLSKSDPSLALALGISAVELAPNYLTRSALYAALAECHLTAMIPASATSQVHEVIPLAGTDEFLASTEFGEILRVSRSLGERVLEVPGHKGRVLDMDVDPGGSLCVSGGLDGTLRAFRIADGDLLFASAGEEGPVTSVCFSPDSTRVASMHGTRTLRITDALTGECLHRLPIEGGGVNHVAFTDAGSRLIAWGRTAVGYELEEPAQLVVFSGESPSAPTLQLRLPGESVTELELDPLGRGLAFLTERGELFRADLTGDGQVTPIGLEGEAYGRLAFDPSGRTLVASLAQGSAATARAFGLSPDFRIVGPARTLGQGLEEPVSDITFDPPGQRMALACGDLVVRLFDFVTGAELELRGTLLPHQVEFTSDGRYLLSRCAGRFVEVWATAPRPDQTTLVGHRKRVTDFAFLGDGRRALTASEDGDVRVWELPLNPKGYSTVAQCLPRTSLVSKVLSGVGEPMEALATDSTGEWLLGRDRGDHALLWHLPTRERRAVLGPVAGLHLLAFHGTEPRLFGLGEDGVARLVAGTSGERQFVFGTAELPVACAAFSADGRYVALGYTTSRVDLHDAGTGALEQSFAYAPETFKQYPEVGAIAFSPDGSELCVAGRDQTLRFFDTQGGPSPRRSLLAYVPRTLAYSPDGSRLLVIGIRGGNAVKLFALDDPERKAWTPEVAHTDHVTSGAFSADGTRMVTVALDGGVHVWEAESGRPLVHLTATPGVGLGAVLSPDALGAWILTSGPNHRVTLWPVDPLPVALARKPREPFPHEWAREQRLALPTGQ